jgi:16S rRNA (adenine1518-N6/adenine1519-N6)-dimethyltransferase
MAKQAPIQALKKLGQHFLGDPSIAQKIADLMQVNGRYDTVLEIGAGTGVLTQFLAQRTDFKTFAVDVDSRSIQYLRDHKILPSAQIWEKDFLKMDLPALFGKPFGIIGNLPYQISSPIFFQVLEHRDWIPEMVCMIQKEVAQRIAAKHGGKEYGILSIFLQAFYDIKYEFSVPPDVFIPPPKVDSAVIRLQRNQTKDLGCDEKLFVQVVKMAFNQRRKTMRNSLKGMNLSTSLAADSIFEKRPEQLSVAQLIDLTRRIAEDRLAQNEGIVSN